MHQKPNTHLLVAAAIIAFAGVLAAVLGNIIGSFVVPDHDWVADTISDLAAGKYEIIQDVALYGFAGAVMACALGAAHLHLDGTRWNIGIGSLAIAAACVVMIGARNEYGDNDSEGIVIHVYIVYVLGFFFAALMVLMARGLGQIARRYRVLSFLFAGLWTIGAPIFFFMPTGYDGAFERGLGLVICLWVVTFGFALLTVVRKGSPDVL